jgi:diacylglycerol kinase (ATP)
MAQPATAGRRALYLVNRHSRRGKKLLPQATHALERLGFSLLDERITSSRHMAEVIRRRAHDVDLVIVGGGDGTLNAAVDGLVDTGLPLGILPLGTGNDLARTLHIPLDLEEACDVIARGQTRRIDLGWVNGHHFFNVASIGLTVRITQQLSKGLKQQWGIFAYPLAALRVLHQARPFRAEIRWDDQVARVRTVQITIGNGRHYGGGMTVAHDATIDDQRLDLYSLEVERPWHVLALLPGMRWGRLRGLSSVRTLSAREIEIRTRRPRPISADGEPSMTTPAIFRVIPRAITVFAPQ